MLKVIGETNDGKLVVEGTYRLYETHGLPFTVIFEVLSKRGAVPCWLSYLREAVAAGVQADRAIGKVGDALSDVWGPEFREVVLRGMELAVQLDLVTATATERRRRLLEYSKALNLTTPLEAADDHGGNQGDEPSQDDSVGGQ